MSKLRAIFFDVGFTLIHPARPMAAALAELLAETGRTVSISELEAAIRAADAEFWNDPRWSSEYWGHAGGVQTMWRRYYRQVFGAVGCPDQEALLADRAISYYHSPVAWQPFDEALAVLEDCKRRGLTVGAISDWGSALPHILQGLGLTRSLDLLLVSANLGIAKPHSELYRMALQRAGVAAEEAIMVGDGYYTDILGARAVGIPAVLIDRRRILPPLDCPVIANLGELFALIDGR